MSNVTAIHQYELCGQCGSGAFHICWPIGNKEDTYIKCTNCKTEFNVQVKLNIKEKLYVET